MVKCYNQNITKAMSLLNALKMKITDGRAILIAEGNDKYHIQDGGIANIIAMVDF
jgi:hypothetical protein